MGATARRSALLLEKTYSRGHMHQQTYAVVLYERLALGKPQRNIPRPNKDEGPKEHELLAEGVAGKVEESSLRG